MSPYGYVAIDRNGKEVKGSMKAEDPKVVETALRSKGLTVVEITKQSLLTQDLNIDIGGKVTPRDLGVFCRQFVSMIRAGVPIIEALGLMGDSTENKMLKEAIDGVHASVQMGDSLAAAMSDYPKVFPEIMINTVAAGEESGSLDKSFERSAEQNEKTARITATVRKAMVYPIMVCIVAVVVVIVMMVVVIPKYTSMFDQLGTELPAITVAVMAISNFIRSRWYVLLAVIGVIIAAISYYRSTDNGKFFFANLQIKMPVFGTLAKKQACSLLARTLCTLISSGVPLEEAIEVTAKVMPNVIYKEAMYQARNEVLQGIPLSKSLENTGLFPPMMYHMVRIGEESGTIEDMLSKMADYYDEEVEMATQTVMEAMQPMIIIVLAIVVGTLVAACMAPMLKMYTALDSL